MILLLLFKSSGVLDLADLLHFLREQNNSGEKIAVEFAALSSGNRLELTLVDSHRVIVKALQFFAQSERVPLSEIDLKIAPQGKRNVTSD